MLTLPMCYVCSKSSIQALIICIGSNDLIKLVLEKAIVNTFIHVTKRVNQEMPANQQILIKLEPV